MMEGLSSVGRQWWWEHAVHAELHMELSGTSREGGCRSPLGDELGMYFWEEVHSGPPDLIPVTPVNISCISSLRAGCVSPGK